MKKRGGKVKMNNKGFSLVELIVVIAIMAVLIGVLAPQYLRYVEKARLQKDNSAIAEIANAIKVAMADETINEATANGKTITIGTDAAGTKTITFASGVGKELEAELALTIGNSWSSGSNSYKNSEKKIELIVNKNGNGAVTVNATGYITTPGGTGNTDPADQVF